MFLELLHKKFNNLQANSQVQETGTNFCERAFFALLPLGVGFLGVGLAAGDGGAIGVGFTTAVGFGLGASGVLNFGDITAVGFGVDFLAEAAFGVPAF